MRTLEVSMAATSGTNTAGRPVRMPRSARRKQLLAAAQGGVGAPGHPAAAMDDIPAPAELLAAGLVGAAVTSAQFWLAGGRLVPKDFAESLMTMLAWRGIASFPLQGEPDGDAEHSLTQNQ